jgi:DNA-binding transcriptional regulator YbjK
MPIRPPTHRAAGHARRAALLEAAIKVIAENGVSGTTHRAVAARAGMPLSTTSYFFASIDELIAAAMTVWADRLIATIEDVRADVIAGTIDRDAMIDTYADLLSAAPAASIAAEFEIYLRAPHRPELQILARHLMTSFERAAQAVLAAAGATDPTLGARSVIALIDGFALQRFAWPRIEADRDQLTVGLRALLHAFTPTGANLHQPA